MNGFLIEITPVLDSLGWAILHSLWQITLAAFLVWFCYKVTNEQHAKQRYFFSGMMVVLCLLAFIFTFGWYLPMDELDNFAKVEYAPTDAEFSELAFAETVVWSEIPTTISASLSNWLSQYTYWISLAWVLGFLVYAFKYSIAFTITMRLRSVGISKVEKEWQERMSNLIFAAKANTKTQLKYSKLVKSPLTIGFFKPLILVPMGFLASLPPEQVEAVLLHEIAHIKRHDYLINLIQTAIKTIFFYHPGIHFISTKIDIEREHLCDDFAIGMTDDPTSLAKALGFLQLQSLTNQNSFAMNSNQRNHPFLSRLKRLFGNEQPVEKIRSGRLILPLLLVFAAVFALTAYTEPKEQVLESKIDTLPELFESESPLIADNQENRTLTIFEKSENDTSKNAIWERLTEKSDLKRLNSLRDYSPLWEKTNGDSITIWKNGKLKRVAHADVEKMFPNNNSIFEIEEGKVNLLDKVNGKRTIWSDGKLIEIEESELKNLFPKHDFPFKLEDGKWKLLDNEKNTKTIWKDGKLVEIDKDRKEPNSLFPKGIMDSIPVPPAPPAPPAPPMGATPFPMPPMPPALQNLPPMPPMPSMPPMNFNMNGDSISNFSKEEWEAYTKEMERHAEKYEEFAARFAEEYSEEMERHLEEHEEKMEQWSEEVERQAEEWAEKMEEQQERYEEQMEEYREHLEKEPNKGMIESKKETNSEDDNRSGSITPEQLQKLQEVILGELIADGFRERKRGFTHMWFKNGNLFINADYVSKDLHDKYAAIFSKYNMATPKKKFIVRRKSFDTTNMTLRGIKSQQSYGPQLIFYN